MDAHKNSLAVGIYNFAFACTEPSEYPSGSRGIWRVQSNLCERHDSRSYLVAKVTISISLLTLTTNYSVSNGLSA